MAILKDLKISRRFALRGALGGVGVAMWLPMLEAMCNNNGTAFAAGGALPTSFGIWFWGNGVHKELWTPTGSGTTWQLPQNLSDFATVQDSMTYVTGLSMMDGVFKGHGWGVAYVLAGGDGNICNSISQLANLGNHQFETSSATQYLPTVDQTIADALYKEAMDAGIKPPPFKSLETGMIPFSGDVAMGTPGNNLAHRGPNDVLPPNRDPKSLFDKLFGTGLVPMTPGTGGSPGTSTGGAPGSTGGSTGVPSDISFRLRRSVLDAVLEDAKRLRATLGTNDVRRLDSHMDGIRTLEQSLPAVSSTGGSSAGGAGNTGGSATAGSTSGGTAECKVPTAPGTLADMTAKSQAINSLVVSALACNLTRVYSHLWSGPRSDSTYPTLGFSGAHHAYTHGTDGMEPRQMEKYIMSQYADLCKRMKATPVGAGTLLDNTLIYGISEQGHDPKNHNMRDYHIVLMGKAGGKLPGKKYIPLTASRKVTELVLTLQKVMGLKVTEWGTWDKTSKTIDEILT
jgi:hypothetical protein